jgi:hypothetical protein
MASLSGRVAAPIPSRCKPGAGDGRESFPPSDSTICLKMFSRCLRVDSDRDFQAGDSLYRSISHDKLPTLPAAGCRQDGTRTKSPRKISVTQAIPANSRASRAASINGPTINRQFNVFKNKYLLTPTIK